MVSMKVLFITSSRIGDAVLSTGLLEHMAQEYPNAQRNVEVTIACGALAASLFEGYPLAARIIPMTKEKHAGHWIKLWKQVVGTRWDIVVDLRDSAMSRLLWAGKRYILSSRNTDKSLHKAAQNAAAMKLDYVPPTKLWFSEEQQDFADGFIPLGARVLGVGPTSNWIGKTWPVERFIEITQWLTAKGGLMEDCRVAVFGAPGEEADAYKLYEALPEGRRIDVIAKGDPGQAAATLARCAFYIGNDSGLMHCAAASGVPTLGLFGPSYDQHYSPCGAKTAFVRTPESFEELTDYEGYSPKTCGCLMESLSVEAVKQAIEHFIG